MSIPDVSGIAHINLRVDVASGEPLDVRQFAVQERISSLFQVNIVAVSSNPSIDFEAIVGQEARFSVRSDILTGVPERFWTGLCKHIELVAVEETHLSTYQLSIVPTLWLATQRRNHRTFQQMTEPDIVLKLLEEWEIEPEVNLTETYKKRKYRVQHAESDFAFMSRMLEDAGISFYFKQGDTETTLVLSDAPLSNEPRANKILFRDNPTQARGEHVTQVRIGRQVRPGRYTMQDLDYRKPADYKIMATAEGKNAGAESKLDDWGGRFHDGGLGTR